MLKVGITGGVSCGKSTVAHMFAARGAYVIRADEVAHELMRSGRPVYAEVVERFGREILNADGTINRPRLAAIAFPNRIKELNALVHPAVVEYQDRWMQSTGERDPNAVAIVEAALIFEAGAHTHFDKLITIICSEDQKITRFAARQQVSPEAAAGDVKRRMAAQLSDVEKSRQSDYVIDNSSTFEHAEAQVEVIWAELKALASQPEVRS